MICPNCGESVRPYERLCVACAADCGFPNVRAADQPEETRALAARVDAARRVAESNGAGTQFDQLREAARKSRAVRVRSVDEVYSLIKSDDRLLGTFSDLKGAGLLRPSTTQIEAARQSAEPIVFLNYHEKIQFAALTLSDTGLFTYGNCAMVFAEDKIAKRSSVFEENCVSFCRRRAIGSANPSIPPGFRASWMHRDSLVLAKLGDRLTPATQEADLPALLLASDSDPERDDFVEVHIYDRLHRSAIDYVVAKPRRTGDKALVRQMKADLDPARVREVSA